MDKTNFNFQIMSFNVRGLNDRKKRRSIFKWIKQKNIDMCLLQETYCTAKVEKIRRTNGVGKFYFPTDPIMPGA